MKICYASGGKQTPVWLRKCGGAEVKCKFSRLLLWIIEVVGFPLNKQLRENLNKCVWRRCRCWCLNWGLSAVGVRESNRNSQRSSESGPTPTPLRCRCYGRRPQSLCESPDNNSWKSSRANIQLWQIITGSPRQVNLHHTFPRLLLHSGRLLS